MRGRIVFGMLIVGGLLVAVGLGRALTQFGALYGQAADDPMAEPEVSEQDRAAVMLRSAGLGAAGVPLVLVGTIMLKSERRRRG